MNDSVSTIVVRGKDKYVVLVQDSCYECDGKYFETFTNLKDLKNFIKGIETKCKVDVL